MDHTEFIRDPNIYYFPTITRYVIKTNKTMNWTIGIGVWNVNLECWVPILESFKDSQNQLPQDHQGAYFQVKWYLDGKLSITTPTFITSGKNLGKKNATNAYTQALADAEAKYNKYKKNHIRLGDFIGEPMLYQDSDISDLVDGKEYVVKTKYDGIRTMLINHKLYSRNGELVTIPVAWKELANMDLGGWCLDFEAYIPGKRLNEIQSAVSNKSATCDIKQDLELYVFDIWDSNNVIQESGRLVFKMPAVERYNTVSKMVNDIDLGYVHAVDWKLMTKEYMSKEYKSYLDAGYEGMIVVDPESFYYFNERPETAIKIKPIYTAECIIKQVLVETKADRLGAKYFEAETLPDTFPKMATKGILFKPKLFKVIPMLSIEERKNISIDSVGKMYTYSFQDISQYGVPLRPQGISFRADL